jgi:hypothetical protein
METISIARMVGDAASTARAETAWRRADLVKALAVGGRAF